MSLTYPNLLALAQTTLDDTSTASGISTAAWLILINAANRDVWRRIIEVNPSYFLASGDVTWPANTEKVTISGASYLNTEPYKILGIDVTPAAGNPSTSNQPRKLRPIQFQERASVMAQTDTLNYGNGYAKGPLGYTYEGSGVLYVAPVVGDAAFMRIFYIAPLADLTGASNDQPLAGVADEFHDAVAYRAAMLANAKRGGSAPLAELLWQESLQLIEKCAAARTMDEPWRVRRVC